MAKIDRLRMLWMAVVTTLAGGWLWGCVGDEDSTENGASDMGAASGGAVAEDGSASDMGVASGGADLGVASGEDCDPSESTVLDGDFSVRSVADGRRIACYTEITGILGIYNDALASLPNLASVGGLDVFDNPTLTRLSLPALTRVGEVGLNVTGNHALLELNLPALTSIGGSLNSAGRLSIYENESMTDLILPALTDVGGSMGIEMTALTNIEMPALRSIGSSFVFNRNEVLTDLNLPALASVGGNMDVSENPRLTGISLSRLSSVDGFLTIFANEMLCQSTVDELVGQIEQALVSDVSGNRDDC